MFFIQEFTDEVIQQFVVIVQLGEGFVQRWVHFLGEHGALTELGGGFPRAIGEEIGVHLSQGEQRDVQPLKLADYAVILEDMTPSLQICGFINRILARGSVSAEI